MTEYRLGSAGFVHAPGMVAWAINGYAFKKDRKRIMEVMKAWDGVPTSALHDLLSGRVPYTVDGDVVVFRA